MDKKLKSKIQQSMLELYNEETYKNKNKPLTVDQMQVMLPLWWKKLERQGLTKPLQKRNFGYSKFVESFLRVKQREELFKHFNINYR